MSLFASYKVMVVLVEKYATVCKHASLEMDLLTL